MTKYFAIGIVCTILAQINFSGNTLPYFEESGPQDTYLTCSGCK